MARGGPGPGLLLRRNLHSEATLSSPAGTDLGAEAQHPAQRPPPSGQHAPPTWESVRSLLTCHPLPPPRFGAHGVHKALERSRESPSFHSPCSCHGAGPTSRAQTTARASSTRPRLPPFPAACGDPPSRWGHAPSERLCLLKPERDRPGQGEAWALKPHGDPCPPVRPGPLVLPAEPELHTEFSPAGPGATPVLSRPCSAGECVKHSKSVKNRGEPPRPHTSPVGFAAGPSLTRNPSLITDATQLHAAPTPRSGPSPQNV